jgi:hypothetical protein
MVVCNAAGIVLESSQPVKLVAVPLDRFLASTDHADYMPAIDWNSAKIASTFIF